MVEKRGGKALVRVARVNCAECGGCGILARDREQVIEFSVPDRLGVEVGDEVRLRVPSGRLYLAYLVVFGLPLLAMAAAYLSAAALLLLLEAESSQGASVIAAVASGFVFFWVGIKLAERLGMMPCMTAVLARGRADGPMGDAGEERGKTG